MWLPISDLRVSSLGLYDDARFPGRCILALREHATGLEELTPDVAAQFILDMRDAGRAVRLVVGSPRINYAVLGNVEPHLHAHIVPRGGSKDPVLDKPPWNNPLAPDRLPEQVITQLTQAIANALG